jgi:hypothetical protein
MVDEQIWSSTTNMSAMMDDYANAIARTIKTSNVLLVSSTFDAGVKILEMALHKLFEERIKFLRCSNDMARVNDYWIKVISDEYMEERLLGLQDYVRFDYWFDTGRKH